MTDNEIIKALNYCCGNIKNNDDECQEDMCYQVCLPESREEGIRWCREWLMKDALDLINRQKAIIEKSEKVEHFADKAIETANAEIERLNIELQSMRNVANYYKMELERLKSEIEEANEADREAEVQALKENKENAKLSCEAINHAKSEAIKEFAERLKENYCFTDRWGKIIPISTIDDLVKEITEVETNQRKEDESNG